MSRHGAIVGAFLLYLAFVVYGSLVPFEIRPHTLDEAIARFANIPWLELGATSRADWVANIVLYVPLAFLACTALAGAARSRAARHLLTLLALLLCLAVAVAVEFAQIFFLPRTVSLNDLLAEGLGSLGGVALWALGYHKLNRLWLAFRAGGRRSLAAAVVAYGLGYLALGLFPFDFVVSGAELATRLDSPRTGWLLAPTAAGGLRVAAGLVAELLAIAPLGVLLALLVPRLSLRRVFVAGLVIGVLLEALQLLLVSGVTQGASLMVRGVGLAAGAWLGRQAGVAGLLPLAHWVRRLWPPLSPLYVIGLIAAAGWFHRPLLDTGAALAQLADTRLLPFYYHYFTTEALAMVSLLANVGMYAPLGVVVWARHATIPRAAGRGWREPALWGALFALPVEISKGWLDNGHPDFTNLLIAAGAAVFSYALVGWLGRASAHGDAETPVLEPAAAPGAPPVREPAPRPPARFAPVSLVAAGALLVGLWQYPVAAPLAALLAVGYGLWLRRRPWTWLAAVPALLPVLDFAPYTGRLLLDGFDLLLLATIAVGYWRLAPLPARPWPHPALRLAWLLLAASALLATAIGLAPTLDGEPLTLAASHSPLEALMVGKGLLWALLLAPLLLRIPTNELAACGRRLVDGLAAGLGLLGLVVLWERQRFVGLADFDSVFRVTGNFSAMYNGGAYIEAYIAVAFPALAVWTLRQDRIAWRLLGIAGIALASYAMLVTYSRGGYAGLVVGLAVVALGVWRSRRTHAPRRGAVLALVAAAVVAAAMPVLLGGFAQGRLAQVERDLATRLGHWSQALGLMDIGPVTAFTGAGFGRYSARYLWGADVPRPPGTFAVRHEDGQAYLRLGAGDAYYLDQIVDLRPGDGYRLQARLRFHGEVQRLRVPVCEKALLYSFHCQWLELDRGDAPAGQWLTLSAQLPTALFGRTGRWPAPTTKLSLAAPQAAGAVDVAGVSLRDAAGREVLANGGFEQGLAHWLPATDRDLAWHIHQTALEVFFAQGLLGLAALGLALFAAGHLLWPGLRRGEPTAVALAGGLGGFLAVGLLGSTLDTARLGLLCYLLCFASVLALSPHAPGGAPTKR